MDNSDREKLMRIVKDREVDRKQSHELQSRERLQENVETKLRTTMIGALAILEEELGFLWGQDKPFNQLNDRELNMRKVKKRIRSRILNHGNDLIRSVDQEMEQYDVSWNRYHYNYNVKDGNVNE